MTRLNIDRGIHVKSPQVQTTVDDAYEILNNLYNFLCDAEQIVVGFYSQFSKCNGKEAAEKLLANNSTETLHKLKLYKNDLNVLTNDTKKIFENLAKYEKERFLFKKTLRKDNQLDQQILSTPEEKIENALMNLSDTMVAKRKQIVQDVSYLQSYSWKNDENSKIFKNECENLSKKSLTLVEQFMTTYKYARKVVKEKGSN